MTLKTCVTAYMICIGNHENMITACTRTQACLYAYKHCTCIRVFMHANTTFA